MTSSKPFRVAILASTNGTDFSAMLEEKRDGKLKDVEFVGLVANKNCGAAERAAAAGVPVFLIDGKAENFHEKLLETVKQLEPDLICMVGYMKFLRADFCTEFENKILNVHPSLLPKFAGKMDGSVHEDVLAAGEKKSGMTIHLATAEVDAGAIICQKEVEVAEYETVESLREKVQTLEKKWYPEVIRWFRDGKIYF
ncbi:MAG: phosphoribosylglycinamide formyltransferase [Patescibacteria group bacterium]